MKRLIYTLLMNLFATAGFSQSIEANHLRWEVNGFHNTSNNEDVTVSSVFETSPTLIKWIQKNGAYVYDFAVTGKSGSWQDVSTDGEITFNVTFRSDTGTIRFVRHQEELAIYTNILKDGANILPYKFNVSNVKPR